MKFIHLSDLHLGKRVNDFSMLEEQRAILDQILSIVDCEAPDGVLIAGDVYDKAVPPAEAVSLFDDFLVSLSQKQTEVFIISGNHDSPERIAFASRIMEASGIHLSPVYQGHVRPTVMEDTHGRVNVYLLPFIKPSHVRRWFEDKEISSYTDALRVAIREMKVDPSERNVLVCHQFVTGAERCDSEEIYVGGSENVSADVFDGFDYVALGHIHGAQNCGSDRIRYCGTPLKYSFSEVKHKKSASIVELGAKGDAISVRTISLTPIHDMSELRGTFAELTDSAFLPESPVRESYLRITLTDEQDIPDAVGRLRKIYPNLMLLNYDNARTRENQAVSGATDTEKRSAYDLFAEFFRTQNNAPMSDEQSAYIKELIAHIEEETE